MQVIKGKSMQELIDEVDKWNLYSALLITCKHVDWTGKPLAPHKFPDTGAQRSWCETCGVVGHFNWRSGQFK